MQDRKADIRTRHHLSLCRQEVARAHHLQCQIRHFDNGVSTNSSKIDSAIYLGVVWLTVNAFLTFWPSMICTSGSIYNESKVRAGVSAACSWPTYVELNMRFSKINSGTHKKSAIDKPNIRLNTSNTKAQRRQQRYVSPVCPYYSEG